MRLERRKGKKDVENDKKKEILKDEFTSLHALHSHSLYLHKVTKKKMRKKPESVSAAAAGTGAADDDGDDDDDGQSVGR